MHRLFIALPLPNKIEPQVTQLTNLFPQSPAIRYEPFAKLHITLAFIGKVTPKKKKIIMNLFSDFQNKFEPTLLEFTPEFLKSSSVIALKLQKNKKVEQLAKYIHSQLQLAGFILDKERFSPHITFARFKRTTPMQERKNIKNEIKANLPDKLFSFTVNEPLLYESTLTRSGSVYTIVAEKNLKQFT